MKTRVIDSMLIGCLWSILLLTADYAFEEGQSTFEVSQCFVIRESSERLQLNFMTKALGEEQLRSSDDEIALRLLMRRLMALDTGRMASK